MDVNEFRADLLEEVHLNATMNGTTPHEEFLAMYVSALTDAEELGDFEQIAFEGVGPAGAISRLRVIVLMKWTTAWRLLSLHFLTVLI